MMECLLGFLRFLLCCYEDDQEENRGGHRYHTIPDFVQTPYYETQRNSSAYIPPTPILSKPQTSNSYSNSTWLSQRETSNSNVVSTNQRSLPKQSVLSSLPSSSPKANQKSLVQNCIESPQLAKTSLPKSLLASSSSLKPSAKTAIPSPYYETQRNSSAYIPPTPPILSKPQTSNSNLVSTIQKSLPKPQTNFHSSASTSSANTLVSNSNYTNSIKNNVLSPLPSPSPNLQKSLVQNCAESPQSSAKSLVASSSTNLKPPAKTAIPSFDYGKAIGIAPQSVKKPQVVVASPKSVALVPPVIQGNICRTQKPIRSLEPSTANKSISESVKRETPSDVRPSAKTSIPSSVNASLADIQSFIKNVASASTKKNKASLTESPQSLKTSVHNPQVGASPKSKDPARLIPSISKPVSREAHKNEQDPFQSPSPSTSLPLSFKPPPLIPIETCSTVSSLDIPKKDNYAWVPKITTPLYSVPEDFKELIKRDIVPQVLRRSLTPATYKNFFEALMYAEDYYYEKWSDYLLEDVEIELHDAAIYMRRRRGTNMTGNRKNKKTNENAMTDKRFVAFQIDSVPERRPFLLSRDYVYLLPSGNEKEVEPYQGVLYRVVHRNLVLAEFGDDFYLQHSSSRRYNVSFSFNRVCLKRSYQALSATTNTLLHNFLFPGQTQRVNMLDPPSFNPYLHNLNHKQLSAVNNILRLNSSPPFLVEGPLSVFRNIQKNVMEISATYFVIQEAVQQIYRSSPGSRILINAPRNIICDWLMKSLMVEIPESEIFRANAAFREQEEVDGTILPLCPFEGECFTCPSLEELQEFRVVLTTYMSSFRLHNQGISSSHFSHIFLVDASSIMEPEMIVSLSNLANEKTVVVVTGAYGNCSNWVRSDMGREYGLKVSYFERLMEREPYCSLDPLFVARIRDDKDDRNDAFPKKTWEGQY